MTVTAPNTEGKGWMSIPITGGTATSAGALAAVLNPEGVDVLITRGILYVSSNSTGGANLVAGVAATATTAGSDIIGTLAMAAAEGNYYNAFATGTASVTEISTPAVWASTSYVVVTGSASTAGLAGTLYIEYLRI